ncbi:flavodoxin domain-containing protein [Nocardia farcinica]|uniref:flavodoxin domain-containing protein n=1 Tax=Nocardia farcinica TaxID=37329 RepID=UPI001895401F|nr:flavodoxin domain-containing protein [Nocardia farcinica]MBF6235026.1 flavodoxin domain-containing protein [Nocardia farcinica]MBF6445321.1 flavodoxin domain-containing protein [Nocardia farcinica]
MSTDTTPRIAVIYATSQGSTRDIAEFLAADLTARGARVQLADAEHAPDPTTYDVLVVGSAVHDMDVLPEAAAYLTHHRHELADHDVHMFTVGLGPALRGPIGRWMGRTVPPKIATLRDAIEAGDFHAFAGRYEHDGVPVKARLIYRLMGGGRYGDLRDWTDIRAWSAEIGNSLGLAPAQAAPPHP